ncbi:glycoside hydrolase family 3 C-terminal domain-containing protein [Mobilitalea sibirica]|uniref:Glycoside hydrolase family 3 C-terminal domain-containing protein n=1 Tax=Mobilitalea sibirica TaxID=1462919 RepID=A0A8J7HB23_9FIRM|nr:glycoside hydrolase family 3 C-terminal domain-containing protein [Mobilitalea sibirica]MBH1939517.1 glycoside hydrolase family 3 C-terminal domain-containing protein [Mobilitalea sibirica]
MSDKSYGEINQKKDSRRMEASDLVKQMTLEEKAGLCSGEDRWYLKSVERLGVCSIMMCDGPHGLRKEISYQDNLAFSDSVPAVCFPTASALACSFDRDLAYEIGIALGEECQKEGVSVLLGPGVNQKRSPLCGRNFEYFSEDPYVSGEMAAAMISGVQSQGVGTSLKHFAVNNQEKRRMTVSAIVDERALRETYLKAFEIAVKKGKPWTVMCAYNQLNGTYCSENTYLLTDILREEWGYEGVVVSDWGAVNDRVLGLAAGLDIEMPGSNGYNDKKIIEAVRKKTLPEEYLDRTACKVTELILKASDNKKEGFTCDMDTHHQLAIRAATESAVLLKNEDDILPGNPEQKAVVIGALAKEPRYQGAGSSKIHPYQLDMPWEALKEYGTMEYAQGYLANSVGKKDSTKEEALKKEAIRICKGKDIVYFFAGLTEGYESEGFDRETMDLPENQNRLIEAVASINPNIVVILSGGAPTRLPWVSKVKGILVSYLGGEGNGKAIADLLMGKAVPCGKLAETWPLELSDTPAYHNFPGGRTTVEYRESVYVGYRYYEAAQKPVLYPFGHGLSYTTFHYSNLEINQDEYHYGDKLILSFDITNTGSWEAKEVAFVFVAHKNKKVFMPVKELRAFNKISLKPGEKKQIEITLDTHEFAYYNTAIHDWYCDSGEYKIMICSSLTDCHLQKTVNLISPKVKQPDYREKLPSYYSLKNEELVLSDNEFEHLYGQELIPGDLLPTRPYNLDHTLMDVRHTLFGKLFIFIIKKMVKKNSFGSKENYAMMISMVLEMPFHSMVPSGGGIITDQMLEGILDIFNGHRIKGIFKIIRHKRG